MQSGNLRADGENGSTVKSPNQDAVIGQILIFYVVYRTVTAMSNSPPFAL